MNSITIEGLLGSDTETRFVNDKKLANVNVADQYKDKVTWHRLEAWDKTADILAQGRKGDKAVVIGYVRDDAYTNKEGKKVVNKVVTVTRVLYIGPRPQGSVQKEEPSDRGGSVQSVDDLPF